MLLHEGAKSCFHQQRIKGGSRTPRVSNINRKTLCSSMIWTLMSANSLRSCSCEVIKPNYVVKVYNKAVTTRETHKVDQYFLETGQAKHPCHPTRRRPSRSRAPDSRGQGGRRCCQGEYGWAYLRLSNFLKRSSAETTISDSSGVREEIQRRNLNGRWRLWRWCHIRLLQYEDSMLGCHPYLVAIHQNILISIWYQHYSASYLHYYDLGCRIS